RRSCPDCLCCHYGTATERPTRELAVDTPQMEAQPQQSLRYDHLLCLLLYPEVYFIATSVRIPISLHQFHIRMRYGYVLCSIVFDKRAVDNRSQQCTQHQCTTQYFRKLPHHYYIQPAVCPVGIG